MVEERETGVYKGVYKVNLNIGGKVVELSGSTPEEVLDRLAERMAEVGSRVLVVDTDTGNPIESPDQLVQMLRQRGTVNIQLVRRAQAGA